MKLNESEIEQLVADRAKDIATILCKGRDVEVRFCKEGVRVIEITKKVV